jgi:single-stranded-DNA-specific exonuclease
MKPDSSRQTAWKVNPYPWSAAQKLADALGLPLVAAMVLAGRGMCDPAEVRKFLECAAEIPDPFLFAHMQGAVGAISTAIDTGRRVTVHGDYDADGITATALMVLGLRDLGLEAEWYLPSRFREGYGLSRVAVETISAKGPGLLITVDCGVNYPEEVALARAAGLEVVVIDHHQPGAVLPECHLIHKVAGNYPDDGLCGVGLALKVLHGLHVRRRGAVPNRLPRELERLLDLVAVGTIADLAALQGENRYYVREGLKLIGIGQRTGLRALAAVSGCTGAADSASVAYRLAPRLNAAGRLADPSPPLRLLLSDDEQEAAALAQILHELNGARQDLERRILDEAIRCVETGGPVPAIIVLAGEDWHEGVVGIVAARLVERYHRPAILLGVRDGMAKGSGRSIARYDIMTGLNACAEHLTVYGGHPQAAGLTLEAERVDVFKSAIERHAASVLSPDDLVPTYYSDAILCGEDINADTALAIESLGPFGSGNPRPRLLLVEAALDQPEATRNGSHLRCTVRLDGVRARGIAFGMGNTAERLQAGTSPRLVGGQLRVDSWQGTLRPEFLIEQLGTPSSSSAALYTCSPECERWNVLGPEVDVPSDHSAAWAAPPGAQAGRGGDSLAGLRLRVARDLRDRPGRISALAQVLASGERTLIVGCSLFHTLREAGENLPLQELCEGDLGCVGRNCLSLQGVPASDARVLVSEWDAVLLAPALARGRTHLVAADPPYRREHVAWLERTAEQGANIHLYYGQKERQSTARLLRYLIHPRFAMVCLYRALQEITQTGDSPNESLLLARAGALAWEEARLCLSRASLSRALDFVRRLDLSRPVAGEAKLEVRTVPGYAEAEAEYEECSRICLSL